MAHDALVARGVAAGLDLAWLKDFLTKWGPLLLEILISLLERQTGGPVFAAGADASSKQCAVAACRGATLCLEGSHHDALHALVESLHACAHCCEAP